MSQSPDIAPGTLRTRVQRWLDGFARRAQPDSGGEARISGRQIYILPTRYGLLFTVMLIAMLLGSNNYGSNPGFLFTFLLAGLAMAALLQTWKNLLGLGIQAIVPAPVFAGQTALVPVRVSATGSTPRGGIVVSPRLPKMKLGTPFDIAGDEWKVCEVALETQRRGWLKTPTLRVSSTFPLGLFRAWAYVETDTRCLVYPAPADEPGGIDRRGETGDEAQPSPDKGDDFSGHRPFQDGDNMHHVDWKVVARGRGWHTKRFDAEGGDALWLRLSEAPGSNPEQRLSALTRAVIELGDQNLVYGLDLGTTVVEPDNGLGHRSECLKALALV